MFLFLLSCSDGGGSDGSGNNTVQAPPTSAPAPTPTLTGVFIDAPVAGLSFSTDSTTGVTNQDGEFSYQQNEIVRFEFGGLLLGSATGQSVLTPLDLLSEQQLLQAELMSFLQSLDADNDHSNGIELSSFSEEQLRQYIAEQPALDTFEEIFNRSDYNSLAGRLTNRSEWIDSSTALSNFEAEIDPLVEQGLYERPSAPSPSPSPVTSEACPSQPRLDLYDIAGGPFNDCGTQTSSRIPTPTTTIHGFGGEFAGDPGGMHFQTVCVIPGWDSGVSYAYPDFPDIDVNAVDQIYFNSANDVGVITFTGTRVHWTDVQNGASQGYVCGPDAEDIEYNGECVCP